jgi:hypothetical protein
MTNRVCSAAANTLTLIKHRRTIRSQINLLRQIAITGTKVMIARIKRICLPQE